jgi:hypothetical protein
MDLSWLAGAVSRLTGVCNCRASADYGMNRIVKVSTVHERGTGVLPQAEILEDVTSTAQG